MMKALFSILALQNRVETNTFFVFDYDVVLALRYLLFFFHCLTIEKTPQNFCDASLTWMANHNYNIVTICQKEDFKILEMERKDKCDGRLTLRQLNDTNSQSQEICYCQRYQSICLFTQFVFNIKLFSN